MSFVEHQFKGWNIQYHPRLTRHWLEAFLTLNQQDIELQPLSESDSPSKYAIEYESRALVACYHQHGFWPWQAEIGDNAQVVLSSIQLLNNCAIKSAETQAIMIRNQRLHGRLESWLIRDFITGISVFERYHQVSGISADLSSLAAKIVNLLVLMIGANLDIRRLTAKDIIVNSNGLYLVYWPTLMGSHKLEIKQQLRGFMRAWIERVDYYQLFVNSFAKAGYPID